MAPPNRVMQSSFNPGLSASANGPETSFRATGLGVVCVAVSMLFFANSIFPDPRVIQILIQTRSGFSSTRGFSEPLAKCLRVASILAMQLGRIEALEDEMKWNDKVSG
jgi:hypothetical protein